MTDLRSLLASNAAPPEGLRAAYEAAQALLAAEDGPSAPVGAALSGPAGAALVELLLDRGDAGRLVALRERAPDKATRKAAGKALYSLKSRGVAIPDAAPTRVATVGRFVEEPHSSHLIAPDSTGAMMILCGAVGLDGRAAGVFSGVEDGAGLRLQNLTILHPMTGREHRRWLETFGGTQVATRIDAQDARSLLALAAAEHASAARLPASWGPAAALLGLPEEPVAPLEHPAWRFATQEEREGLGALEETAVRTMWTAARGFGWPPSEAELETLFEKFSALAESTLLIDRGQIRPQIERLIESASDRFFVPERRLRFARRFEAHALDAFSRGDRSLALAALAAAVAFRDLDRRPSVAPPVHDHFAYYLDLDRVTAAVEKRFEAHQAGGEGDDDGEGDGGSLIIKP
jgi:hypothetical protein